MGFQSMEVRKTVMKNGERMTFEKWLEEMKKQMAMEMVFPSTAELATGVANEEMKEYIEEDEIEE